VYAELAGSFPFIPQASPVN